MMQSPAIPLNCWIILLISDFFFPHTAHRDFSAKIALQYCLSKQVEDRVCSSKDNVSHKELFELEHKLRNVFFFY